MKTFFGLLILSFFVMSIESSCDKTNNPDTPQQQKPPISLDSMLLCHQQKIRDSTEIYNALVGEWQWEFIKCYWTPESANNQDFKNLSLEFKQNDSLDVRLNEQITQKSSWKLTRTNDGYFKLIVSPIVNQLPGKVIFCGSKVLFYDSYVDGCDNFFRRKN